MVSLDTKLDSIITDLKNTLDQHLPSWKDQKEFHDILDRIENVIPRIYGKKEFKNVIKEVEDESEKWGNDKETKVAIMLYLRDAADFTEDRDEIEYKIWQAIGLLETLWEGQMKTVDNPAWVRFCEAWAKMGSK